MGRRSSRPVTISRTLTPQDEIDGATYSEHFVVVQLGNASSSAVLSHGDDVVKIDDARPFHSVLDVERYLRGNAANRRRDRSDRDPGKVIDRSFSRQYQNWPRLVGTREFVETDLAAF